MVTCYSKESYFYAPAWTAEGLTTGTIPAAFRATAARVAPDLATRLNEIIRLEGITVLGYPLGSDDYCRGVLNKLREKICEDLPALEQLDDGLAYLQRAFTFGDTDEGFLALPLMELTAPVAFLSAHTRFIRWVTTLWRKASRTS